MSPQSFVRCAAAFGILLLGALAPPAAGDPPGPAPEAGDSWETTSQMSMEGMPMAMPAQTRRVCTRRDWNEPPAGMQDDQCRATDFKTAGSKSTWNVQCSGAHPMTGHGEITRTSPDAYSGFIRLESADGAMTLKLSGKRVGACRLAR